MLLGDKIKLRPLKIDDLEKTHEWRNNSELVKLTQGIRFPKTMEMDRDWFGHALNDKSNRNIYFGLEELSTKKYIGVFQLTNIDYISRNGVLGFIIGDMENQGKGYGYQANSLLINFAFHQLNLKKIISYIVEDNIPSIKLFNKLGFKQEGILKKHFYVDRTYKNVVIMSLINNE